MTLVTVIGSDKTGWFSTMSMHLSHIRVLQDTRQNNMFKDMICKGYFECVQYSQLFNTHKRVAQQPQVVGR